MASQVVKASEFQVQHKKKSHKLLRPNSYGDPESSSSLLLRATHSKKSDSHLGSGDDKEDVDRGNDQNRSYRHYRKGFNRFCIKCLQSPAYILRKVKGFFYGLYGGDAVNESSTRAIREEVIAAEPYFSFPVVPVTTVVPPNVPF